MLPLRSIMFNLVNVVQADILIISILVEETPILILEIIRINFGTKVILLAHLLANSVAIQHTTNKL